MEILIIVAITLCIIRLGVFSLLHVKFPHFSILKNTVSDYGTDSSRQLYTLMGSLSLLAYTSLFAYLFTTGYEPTWLTIVLGTTVVGSIAILLFPTDLTGKKMTRTGHIHWGLAILNFATLFIFMTNATVPNVTTQPDILVIATWVVRITFYAFLASLVLPKFRKSYIGLTERLFLIATPLWFIVFGSLLLAQ